MATPPSTLREELILGVKLFIFLTPVVYAVGVALWLYPFLLTWLRDG